MIKKILVGILILVALIQFIRIDTQNPESNHVNDLIAVYSPPEKVKFLLKNACYDCHSNHTKYPWYSQIAPISWWLKKHIDNGKKHVNFSEFGTLSPKERLLVINQALYEIQEKNMPLKSYTLGHPEAKLSVEETKTLTNWFTKLATGR